MKNKLILTSLLLTSLVSAQEIKFEPLFKVGIYSTNTQYVMPTEETPEVQLVFGSLNVPSPIMEHTINKTFEYYTTIGGRLQYKSLTLESKNKVLIATDDFVDNYPYNIEFYLKAYYSRDKIKIGVEHLCVHPIETGDIGMTYNVRGGHNEVFFSYNFN